VLVALPVCGGSRSAKPFRCPLARPRLPLALSACAIPGFSQKKDDGLSKVDDLLSKIEQVQAESVLSKERSAAAIDALTVMVDPDFSGDPVASYGQLSSAIKESKSQAQKLAGSIAPMKSTATVVFDEWTASLESFGNTKMRKHSQARLEQTRTRYEAVLQRAVAAQISYDALNADLHDHALFLEHDFNPEAVALLAEDVGSLDEQGQRAQPPPRRLHQRDQGLRRQRGHAGSARDVGQRSQAQGTR
jgi:hypothetical protein